MCLKQVLPTYLAFKSKLPRPFPRIRDLNYIYEPRRVSIISRSIDNQYQVNSDFLLTRTEVIIIIETD